MQDNDIIVAPTSQETPLPKKQRNSNLELYRILCMLLIVAHHYVVNSGLRGVSGPIAADPTSLNSLFLSVFGAWGKTGINCFLMITGYFMCTSQITFRKLLKLLLQVLFYNIVIFAVFYIAGYESISLTNLISVFIPIWGLKDGFVSCFIIFYMTIPFWNILIKNMSERQHQLLLTLVLGSYTLLGSIPRFDISFNYITWFGIIYLIASYIRLYPKSLFEGKEKWAFITILVFLLASVSIVLLQYTAKDSYFFVIDTNKIFAVLIAVSSFLWFKNMEIKMNKVINAFGAGAFGVLLIHANSNAMRTWLWKDFVDVIGHYSLPFPQLILYSMGGVIYIFIVCNLIDQLRIATIEKLFFKWYDNKIAVKVNALVNKIIT